MNPFKNKLSLLGNKERLLIFTGIYTLMHTQTFKTNFLAAKTKLSKISNLETSTLKHYIDGSYEHKYNNHPR